MSITEEEIAALQILDQMDEENGLNEEDPFMEEGQLCSIIDSELKNSHGDEDGQLSGDRAKALDYYFNRPRGDEVSGRSKVQTSDVMDVIEWLKPDIIEAFTTNEDAIQFIPFGERDIDQARIESRYVNYIFYNDAGGYMTLHDIITDALISKNGIVKTVYIEKRKTRYLEYTDLTEMDLRNILKGRSDVEVEIYEQESHPRPLIEFDQSVRQQVMNLPEVQEQIQAIHQQVKQVVGEELYRLGYNENSIVPSYIQQELANQSQQLVAEAMQEVIVTLYDVKIKAHYIEKKAHCINVPPENFRINQDHTSLDVNDARFTAHICDISRSDLLELGIDPEIVDDLTPAGENVDAEQYARRYHHYNNDHYGNLDPSTNNIEVEDIWMHVDFDQDDIAELRHIMKTGNTILLNEYADENPFSCISPIMVPHRWVGVYMFDRMKQIQDIGTAVWRQLLDNFYRANHNRTIVVENQVNMDDLLSPRAAGFVRARNIDAVKPFPHTPIGAEAYALMEKLSKVRMERSGVGPEMMAEGMVIDNDTAHGVERLMAAKEKLVGIIIRNFAETGIADIFKKLHCLVIKYQDKPRMAELNGKWYEIDPSKWKYRNGVRVKVGLGAGDKIRHAGVMGRVLMNQKLLAETGKAGILVDDESIYNALCDEIRFEGIRNPEQYYVDPRSEEAVQRAKELAKKATEPKLEDKILMLESQIEQKDALLREMKQFQDFVIKKDEQMRKWKQDADDRALGWAEIDIKEKQLSKSDNNG